MNYKRPVLYNKNMKYQKFIIKRYTVSIIIYRGYHFLIMRHQYIDFNVEFDNYILM